MSIREIKEGLQYQGADESLVYTLTTTPWGSSPVSPTVVVWSLKPNGADNDRDADVTSTVMSGSPSVNGDVITLPPLASLTAGKKYRVEIKFTCSGNTFEAYAIVKAEK